MSDWDIRMLYDGACPLCSREVRWLRRRDVNHRIEFEDIADAAFDPTRYGLTHERVAGRMHGVLPDGTVVTGVEVFRRVYRAIGLGWLVAPTGWPILRPICDLLYAGFARVRPWFSGLGRGVECGDRCRLDARSGPPGES